MDFSYLTSIIDWALIGKTATVLITVCAVITLIYTFIRLIRSTKKLVEKRGTLIRERKLDEIGREIKQLSTSLNLFVDGLAEAPPKIRDPYSHGLKAFKEWRLAEARDYFVQALEETKDYSLQTEIHLALGKVLTKLADFEGAYEHYEKALKTTEYTGDDLTKSWALNGLGIIKYHFGDYNEALNYYEEGLNLAEKVKDDNARGANIGNIGVILMDQGKLDEAYGKFKEAMGIDRTLGDIAGVASELGNIGIVYSKKRDLDSALENFKESLRLYRTVSDPIGEAANLANIGIILTYKGDLDKAEKSYLEGLEISRRVGNILGEGITLSNLGLLYLEKKDVNKALKYLNMALSKTEKVKASYEVKRIKKGLAQAQALLKEKNLKIKNL